MALPPGNKINDVTCDAVRVSDEQILYAFLKGDEMMFAELVRRHERPLYAFICRLTGRPSEAPDLFQETFLRVFEHAASFRGDSSFKAWLYAIAANTCRSHGRKMLREASVRMESNQKKCLNVSPNPHGAAESSEIGSRVAVAVGSLPLEQREVFVLRTYDEISYREIADIVGRPLGTVKSQMRQALIKLRAQLREIAQAHGVA